MMISLYCSRVHADLLRLWSWVRVPAVCAKRDARDNTFKALAEEWLERQTDVTEGTVTRHRRRLERFVCPKLGQEPIDDIGAKDLLAVLRRIEAQGKYDTAKRVRELCSGIWIHAIHEGNAEFDIASSFKGAIKTSLQKPHAAITDPKQLGGLLRAIDGYEGYPLTLAALKLSALLFVRRGPADVREYG
jgi:integrase